ncbi:MAG: alpha/beta fold hydrolase [Gammaproteobacteria bacterium]
MSATARRVLFLPGAGGSASFWRPVGERLPADWDKRYLSWPGLGDEPHDPAVRGFADLVARTVAALDDTPTDLVAQSMGGAVALRVALDQPARVRRLVLCATSGGLDVGALGAADWRADYRAAYPRAADWITRLRLDFSAEMATVEQPALLLWADADTVSPPAVGERLRAALRHATLTVLDTGDHGFAHALAARVAPLIAAHLA